MGKIELLETLQTMGNVEELANGYYYVETGDAYYMVDPNCDLENINMFVGYAGLGGYGSGGRIEDGRFTGKSRVNPSQTLNPFDAGCYWNNMNDEDPEKLYDAYVLPKNKNNKMVANNFTDTLNESGANVSNATIYGFSSSDITAFETASNYHDANPDASMQVIVGDNNQLYNKKSVMENCSNLNDDNVTIYCLGHDGSSNGWGVAQYISQSGYDNVYEIQTDNNIHIYTNTDVNAGLSACLAGIIPSDMVNQNSSNPNCEYTNWRIQKWTNGEREGDSLYLDDYATNYLVLRNPYSTLPTTTNLSSSTIGDVTIDYTLAVLELGRGDNVCVHKDELLAFANSAALNALVNDPADAESLRGLVLGYQGNNILEGDIWNLTYTKLDIYDQVLADRAQAASELGAAIKTAIDELLTCFTDYETIDTSELPELEKTIAELEKRKSELEAQKYKLVDSVDAYGRPCKISVEDKSVVDAINAIQANLDEARKMVAAINKLQETYDRVIGDIEKAMEKVSAFSTAVQNITPSSNYVYST